MKAYRITLTGPFSVKLNRPLEREYLVFALSTAQARTLFNAWFYHNPATLADNSEDWDIKSIREESPDKILWLH